MLSLRVLSMRAGRDLPRGPPIIATRAVICL